MKKAHCVILSVVVLLGSLLWWCVHYTGEIAVDLVYGWWPFLSRLLPQMTVREDGLAVMGIGLLGLTLIGHWVLQWLYREMAGGDQRIWRFRWTLALVGLVLVMFVAGTAMIGAVHQLAWLIRSEEPFFGEELTGESSGSSRNQLLEMGLAVHNFEGTYRSLPTHWKSNDLSQSWVTQILIYLNYYAEDFDPSRPWDDPANASTFRSIVPPLINPEFRAPPLWDQGGYALNHYAGNSLLFEREEPLTLEQISDGTSNTLMVGQVNSRFAAWGSPDNSRDPRRGINTPGGFGGPKYSHSALFLMADGSVRTIEEDIDPQVLEALSTPDGDP